MKPLLIVLFNLTANAVAYTILTIGWLLFPLAYLLHALWTWEWDDSLKLWARNGPFTWEL